MNRSVPAADRGVFRQEGEYWTIDYEGTVCRLKDAKGLQCLAHLLRHPHEDVSAFDLDALGGDAGRRSPAAGNGGAADQAQRERARVNVTRVVRQALGRVAVHHPALGGHLMSTVRTGAWCSYRPDPRVPIRWEA